MHYKGYSARSEHSAEDHIFYGTILEISDMVDFESGSAEALEDAFHKAVDDYLAFCKEVGKGPQKGKNEVVLQELKEIEEHPERYKKYSTFRDALNEVLADI